MQRLRHTEQQSGSETGTERQNAAGNVLSVSSSPGPQEALPYRVELWDPARGSVERILGDAISAVLGRAIFQSALQEYPGRHITLRYGSRIIARSDAPHPPAAT